MPGTDAEYHNANDLTEQDNPVDYPDMGVYAAPPTSPGNSSLVLDLTADELNFINDFNDTTQSGSNTILDDDAFAFFVEAGLDDPEELSMLGIDIEEIRNQRAIAERLEQQRRADLETARQLQQEEEIEQQQQQEQEQRQTQQNNLPLVVAGSSSGPLINLDQPSSISSSSQSSSRSRGKRRMEYGTTDQNKRTKVEVEVKPIELIDDDDCIDLTNEIEGTSYGPIRVDDIDEGSSSGPIRIDDRIPMYDICDIDSDSDLDGPTDYLSFADYIRRHQHDDEEGFDGEDNDRYIRDPFTSVGTGEFYDDFGNDSTLISILGHSGYTYTEGNGNFQRPRAPPPIMNYPNGPHRQTPQDAERELRNLLEHVIFDDPPPPEDRTGTPDGLSIVLMEHQKIGLQWMLKMEDSRNRGGILADDMGLGKTIQAMAVIVQNTCDDFTPVDHSLINGNGSRLSDGELHIKATLIVCPVSLIDQWRREIESKTSPKLNVLVYHGSVRTQNPYDLARYDGKIYIYIYIFFKKKAYQYANPLFLFFFKK
ncbi:MAG: DEAD/DEAH box helicase [Paenibacillus sp.]|nr:DEAD/DEAH box helicase [Paenibacillus sp.]